MTEQQMWELRERQAATIARMLATCPEWQRAYWEQLRDKLAAQREGREAKG